MNLTNKTMKKLNLDEILQLHMNSQELVGGHGLRVKAAMIDFGKRLLELAKENAKVYCKEEYISAIGGGEWETIPYIDEMSITNTINQVEQ